MNPFKHGQIVTGDDFCGRREELKVLHERIEAGRNVVLYGERRCGKSSLIAEAVRRSKNRQAVFVDLLNVRSVEDVCRRIAAGLFKLEKAETLFRRLARALTALRPTLSLDPLTGSPSLGFETRIKLAPDSIVSALHLLEEVAKSRRIVIVFDEFQSVLNLNQSDQLLALMRGEIQRHGDLCYLFAGSIRHEMYKIFSDADSPFFKSATIMNISLLDHTVFNDFLKHRFALGGRTLPDEASDLVFRSVANVPGDVQHLCEAVWDVTSEGQTIEVTDVQGGLSRIVSQYSEHFQTILTGLTEFQIRCLNTLARVGGDHVNSNAFMQHGGFTNASSINHAIQRLCKLGVLTNSGSGYCFVNPFFAVWVRLHVL